MPRETQKISETGSGASAALMDDAFCERLLAEHRELVRKLARLHLRSAPGMGVDELISEGELGLLRAARKFDPAKGVKFATYASYWIKQGILKAIGKRARTVRLPWQSVSKLRRLSKARSSFETRVGRQPDEAELAEEAGLSRRSVRNLNGACLSCVSLEEETRRGGESGGVLRLLDCVPDPGASPFEELERKDSLAFFARALSTLDAREAEVLRGRFGLEGELGSETCESLGARIGLSREGVRKVQERSLEKLRGMLSREFGGRALSVA